MQVPEIVGKPQYEVASMYKVAYHHEKVSAYLEGERIFPATLELDLTNACTRTCDECPSSTATRHDYLPMEFLDRLFGILGGQTRGLLLTGGEATMAPLFPAALALARHRGFEEIVVVTNGSRLDSPSVIDALLQHVTTIRMSLYDWDGGSCQGAMLSLRRIQSLRHTIEKEGSQLRIGVSVLTSGERADALPDLAQTARSFGAHWIYFHPLCSNWGKGCPAPVSQNGVLEAIEEIQLREMGDFEVFTFADRYTNESLQFDRYHAAHFLLVIGADGRNYMGPEVKYQPRHVIADLGDRPSSRFLWDPDRLRCISNGNSLDYPAIRSRHRGVLYNHFIAGLDKSRPEAVRVLREASQRAFRFPHIL